MKAPHRDDIDGLRTVAVLPVMLFHAGVPGMAGGFVGVDVFFVISGYLITKSLLDDAGYSAAARIGRFYQRRSKRILPALLTMLAVTLVAGYLTFLPAQFNDLAASAIAAVLFASNFWFWATSGYFAAPAEMMPLLHTWSLAVEEQFYIAFPLLLIAFGLRTVLFRNAVLAAALLGFALNAWLTYRSPGVAFYWPVRSWELLAGSALILYSPQLSERSREIVAAGGLAMIAVSVLMFSGDMRFPGFAAALPVLGTVGVIAGGPSTAVGRALSLKPIVWIGLISYSLYLWHWPILVFAKQITVSEHLEPLTIVICIALTFAVAALSYYFVETPARRRDWRPRILAASAIGGIAAVALAGIVVRSADGMPQRFSAEAVALASARTALRPDNCRRIGRGTCQTGDGDPVFALIGDSHAGAISPAFEQSGPGLFFAFNGCSPLQDNPNLRGLDLELCAADRAKMIEAVANNASIETVIFAGYWAAYAAPERATLDGVMSKLTHKEVVVLGDTPTPGFNVPWTLALGGEHEAIQPAADPSWFSALAAYPNVRVARLSEALCNAGECAAQFDGSAVYSDRNHLSEFAARRLVAPFIQSKLAAD